MTKDMVYDADCRALDMEADRLERVIQQEQAESSATETTSDADMDCT